ncbi:hypothetical protein FHR99_000406 [Litorivivens lipolytica]|uniref:DUF3604 domain-containing protein n=1 Tax=Litorivivens lipolytica TaxID=1524264 RepID=A0A7W4W2L7_9GAMM|nr:DUF3604 domain-containing protein [Litorivivens lipolytica]MBB3046170.1 hypothetical protein [Litorivivens lipolytica]
MCRYRGVVSLLLVCLIGPLQAIERTESREPCKRVVPTKMPLFGDTHVHTRYSLDASTQDTRTTPRQAYEFARGARIGIQPWTDEGKPLRELKLNRPLDFAVVTDHAELLGEVAMCQNPELEGYSSWQCRLYRRWPRAAFFLFNTKSSAGGRLGLCGDDGQHCKAAAAGPWQEMQQAAESSYDRSERCEFTSFIGYEWTGASENLANLHRNVIFRNASVPALPFSFVDDPTARGLWNALERDCLDQDNGCDALVIPHNSNLSDGYMFNLTDADGVALTDADLAKRSRLERLVEVMQHKGSSECFFGPGQMEDELCAFEQLPYDKFSGKFMKLTSSEPEPNDGFLRDVLNDGLLLQQSKGINPYKMGFIASTDTHLGAPGAVEESNFPGHGGAGEPASVESTKGLPDDLEFNPGGLAVVWAEENSRDAIFEGMQRRETYGTSGPRMTVRFFGGADLQRELCVSPDFVEQAYQKGVPMGSELAEMAEGEYPRFLVSALMDPGTMDSPGTPLQRIQIIKGWVDAAGEKHQRVYEIAGNPDNGATVNPMNCRQSGEGYKHLCRVWSDPSFDPSHNAYYYARVVENPSCRWSQQICVANGVNCSNPGTVPEGLEICCSDEHRPDIQERAWTSPIWYTPKES